MRWIKLLTTLTKAKFRSKVKGSDTTSLKFRVWVTDIDVSVMNHAAIMTVFEMGRLDYMVRTNFFKLVTKNKWFFPNQSIDVQFYRPLKMFQKGEVFTKMSFVDDTFFYVEQKIMRNGKPVAACFANGLVKNGSETIAPEKIIEMLDIEKKDVPKENHQLISLFNDKKDVMTKKVIENWDV
jgi:acyl-CoA thioesterase FadM